MKAPKRIQVSFSPAVAGESWEVPIRQSTIPAQIPLKRAKFGRLPERWATDELVDRIVLLLLHHRRMVA